MAEATTQTDDPPLGLRFVRDLDATEPAVRDAVLKGREMLSRRAARRRQT